MKTINSKEIARNAYYVTLGAVSLLEEKTSGVVDRLIKEGEKSEKVWKKTISGYQKTLDTSTIDLRKAIETRYEKMADSLGIKDQANRFAGGAKDILLRIGVTKTPPASTTKEPVSSKKATVAAETKTH